MNTVEKLNDTTVSKTGGALLLVALVIVLACAALTIYRQQPPATVGAGAPATEFSSGRALEHLKIITREPHPIGSPAHAAVRDYLLRTLSDMGLQPEVQEAVGVRKTSDGASAASVRNIVARMEGTEPQGKDVLLVAHYDAVPNSYGASDDGAGVVAVLETLRALRSGPPLKNDVVALFTDGEELGMLGARAFVKGHPLFKDTGVVLNFEARGSGGPAYMFETSERNGVLVDAVDKTAPYPFATSLLYSIYKLLPNDTDLTIFKDAGAPALNFAYVGGATRYHTMKDSMETLDERSVQHLGSYALGLARDFGGRDLANLQAGDAVFFDLFGLTLVKYPAAWVLPLCGVVLLLFAGVLVYGVRRGFLTLKGVGFGFAFFLLALVCAAGLVTLTWWGLGRLSANSGPFSNAGLNVAGFIALALAVVTALYFRLSRRSSPYNLYAGALLCWALLMVLTSIALPGAAYLFTWPLFFCLLALGASFLVAARRGAEPQGSTALIFTLAALPGVVLMTTLIYGVYQWLGVAQPAVLIALVVLLCGLLLPLRGLLAAPRGWALPAILLVLGFGLAAAGNFVSPYSSDNPQADYLVYSLDANNGEAMWVGNEKSSEWSGQFFKGPDGRPRRADGKQQAAKAPALPLSGDDLKVVGERVVDGVRVLDLNISSPRNARRINVAIQPGAEILGADINGERIQYAPGQSPSKGWELTYAAVPAGGINLSLSLRPGDEVQIRVSSYTDGLPAVPGMNVRPRPDDLIPSSRSDVTRVTKLFTLGSPADAQRALLKETERQ